MHFSALCVHLCWEYDKLQQFITTCMMQVACECNSFEGILVVAQPRQEDVRDGYDTHLLQPFIFFISALMYPHVLGLCTYVCTWRRVEESCTCMCFCVCVNNELGDSSSIRVSVWFLSWVATRLLKPFRDMWPSGSGGIKSKPSSIIEFIYLPHILLAKDRVTTLSKNTQQSVVENKPPL